jgi:DNA-binding MarR family transcriptional regulator
VGEERPSAATSVALTRAITTLRGRLRQESQPDPSELSLPQLHALSTIVEEGPIANATLAAREHVKPQSMNEWVRVLEARELVERAPDPDDARRVLFTATPAGRRTLAEISDSRHAWLADAIEESLSPAEQQVLAAAVDLMERIAAAKTVRAPDDSGG